MTTALDVRRVGISGSYGGLNLGDEAILQSIVSQLRASLPVEITVFSRDAKDTMARHKVDHVVPVRDLSREEVLPSVEGLDLLILGGGGILYDGGASVYLREVALAQERRVPVLVYAVSAGPLQDSSTQALVRDCLNRAAAVTVRERRARQVLEAAGVRAEIEITADPALLLDPEPLPPDALKLEGLRKPATHRHVGEGAPPAGTTVADLMPSDHGPGEPAVSGALERFLGRLVAAGGAIPPSEQTGFVVPFDPEVFKQVALDVLDDAGVRYLFHAFASGVIGAPRLDGVIFETKSGPVVITAGATVDCTGDGDIAALAGAPFEIGRDIDGLVQPMTLMFRMVEFERAAFAAYREAHPEQWRGVHGLWDLISKATAAGELDLPREDVLFFGTPHEREVSVNTTRVTGMLGTSVWDLTRAEWLARHQMRHVAAFLRRYVPGFEKAYVAQSGVHVGVRETRRIIGEYQLTAADVLQARKWDDTIAQGTYPIDIHNPAGKGTVLRRVPAGEAYDIPLRCLLPQRVDRLTVGGRCLSGTHEAHSSYRVMPIAMATGQAAGVCAALAARTGKAPRDVPAGDVQEALRRQGARLDPSALPRR